MVIYVVTLTWYGTYSIKLEYGKNKILFDPFIRYDKKGDDDFKKNFYGVNNIFITHGHIDHTMDLVKLYNDKNVKIHVTNSPYKRLLKDGLSKNKLRKINYNDNIKIDNINVKVIKGKHIKFDLKLILNTLFNKNVIKYFKNLCILAKNNFKCKEAGETVSYYVNINNLSLLFMGSMALDENTSYPQNIDYLILAYQGRSDLDKKINNVLNVIKPKNLIVAHFDDSFPPVSKKVDLNNLKKVISKNINLIIPEHDKKIILKKK